MFYQREHRIGRFCWPRQPRMSQPFFWVAAEPSSTLCFSLLPTLSSCCCSLCSRASRLSSRIRGRTIHGLSFRDVDRNGDAHFCPCTCPAPNSKSRVDVFCALTHSAKTPVRIALSLKGFGLNSAAIVTNEHAQEVVLVLT